jgi:CRP-like cAMP-binding protein
MTRCPTTDHVTPRFLANLTPLECDSVIAAASRRRYLAHSVIANQGEPADCLFLLTKGLAKYFFITEEGRQVPLPWIAPGDIFGVAALLPRPASYLVSVEMFRDGCVSVWRRRTARKLAIRYPRLVENALSVAADYLEWVLAAHLTLIGKTARQRVHRALLTIARDIGNAGPDGISLDITNEQLANAANITPFTASRLLSELQRSGVIVKSRGKVLLHSRERVVARGA